MHPSRIAEHVCPQCRSSELAIEAAVGLEGQDIESGTIRCRSCGMAYPIVRGLLRFVPASNYAESFGFQWNIHAQTQLDSYSKLPISRDRLCGAIGGEEDLRGSAFWRQVRGLVVSPKCLVSSGANVVSFDYSNAVDANARNQRGSPTCISFRGISSGFH